MNKLFIGAMALLLLPSCGSWLFVDASVDDELLALEPAVLWTVTYPTSPDDWTAGLGEPWCLTDNDGLCSLRTAAHRDDSGKVDLTIWLDLDGTDWDDADAAGIMPAPSDGDPWQARTVDQATLHVVTESFDFTVDDLEAP